MNNSFEDEEEFSDIPDKPSKSQRKRDMTALQETGEQLMRLSAKQLANMDLPEELLDAITIAKTLRKNEALRRQKQYIGRLMRGIDIEPITKYLATLYHQPKKKD